MRSRWMIVVLLLVLPFLPGCGTAVTLFLCPPEKREVYMGVKEDVSVIHHEVGTGQVVSAAYWILIDLPLSAIGDTLILPVTLVQRMSTPPELVEQVRSRLPHLKTGMTEDQVMQTLSGLPFGEEILVGRTVSGGKTVRYALAPQRYLELTFIPHGHEVQPGGLTDARITE